MEKKSFHDYNYQCLFQKKLFDLTHELWTIIKTMFFQLSSSVQKDFISLNEKKVQIYLRRREGKAASKSETLPVIQMPHFMRMDSVLVFSALPYQLTDGYLQWIAGGPPRGYECKDKIRKMQWPQTEGRWISLGFSFGWISR